MQGKPKCPVCVKREIQYAGHKMCFTCYQTLRDIDSRASSSGAIRCDMMRADLFLHSTHGIVGNGGFALNTRSYGRPRGLSRGRVRDAVLDDIRPHVGSRVA